MSDWKEVEHEVYVHADGRTVRREWGKTPNGNNLGGRWVYRGPDGSTIDFDTYWNDLIPRNGLDVLDTPTA